MIYNTGNIYLYGVQERNEIIKNLFEEDEKSRKMSFSYSKYGYVLILSGLLIIFASYSEYIGKYYILGIAFIIAGLFLIRNKLNALFDFTEFEIPDDEKIKELFLRDINENVVKRACFILGIDESEIKEEHLFKIIIPDKNNKEVNEFQLSDGSVIFADWDITLFFFGKHSLFFFKCKYNWLENIYSSETSEEFFYESIASIKNESFINDDNTESEKLVLSNVSGEKIECELPASNLMLPEDFNINNEMFLRNMRTIIREKRYGENTINYPDDVDFEIEDKRTDD